MHLQKEFRTIVAPVKDIQIFKYTNIWKNMVDRIGDKLKNGLFVKVFTNI